MIHFLEDLMKIKDFLSEVFLFGGLTSCELDNMLDAYRPIMKNFSRGDSVLDKEQGEGVIGFVMSGRVEVRQRKYDGSFAVLNTLGEKDSFGVLSVFSKEPYPTELVASKNSSVVFFTDSDVKKLVREMPIVAENLISFMAERISFLNKKIQTFSGTRVEDRLLSYLKSKSEKLCSDCFPLNLKKCSEAINAGRASVYRAIDSLVTAGIISYDEKQIKILNTERTKQ